MLRLFMPPLIHIIIEFFNKIFLCVYRNNQDISKLKIECERIVKKECVILGNGPSLKKSLENDLDFISNRIVFCVNFFATSDYFEVVKPKFYVFADPGFWGKQTSLLLKDKIEN